MNRPDLMALVGQRVTVTTPGPIIADPETGKLVALADHPTLILDLDNGRRMVFSQDRCEVVLADDTPPEPGQPVADDYRQRVAEAIAAKFTYPVYLCDRDGGNERVENAEPADRIDQTPYVMVTAGDGCRSFWTPTCAELADAISDVRDQDAETLRSENEDLRKRADAAEQEAARLRDDIAAARALHPTPAELAHANSETGPYCPTCITIAPCPTRTALDGEDANHG